MQYFIVSTKFIWIDTWWGNWYVVIPRWHKLYWVHYNDIDVDVHWWLTFSDFAKNLTTLPIDCNDDDWIIGFDTAHWLDTRAYRTRDHVMEETKKLKEQIENYK